MLKRLTRKLFIRRVVSAVSIILLLVTTSAAPQQARAKNGCIWYKNLKHYTDVSYTIYCGNTRYFCSGEVVHGGCRTVYSTVQECECIEEP